MTALLTEIDTLDPGLPVLIAGPTASGKSALALAIAERQGGVIVNADALQVFSDWKILTARPSCEDEQSARHALYGTVPGEHPYSVGDWLRDLHPILSGPERAIIVGGTGLYFTALTEGLADIPPTPAEVRAQADWRISTEGSEALLRELDPETAMKIDRLNPVRIQRAWEVQATTGRGLADWHRETAEPLLPLSHAQPILLDAERHWLAERIRLRFTAMLRAGLLDEARSNKPGWSPSRPSAKAIGAEALMAHLAGEMTITELEARVTTLTRQYAKRQRTWFRNRMRSWKSLPCH